MIGVVQPVVVIAFAHLQTIVDSGYFSRQVVAAAAGAVVVQELVTQELVTQELVVLEL